MCCGVGEFCLWAVETTWSSHWTEVLQMFWQEGRWGCHQDDKTGNVHPHQMGGLRSKSWERVLTGFFSRAVCCISIHHYHAKNYQLELTHPLQTELHRKICKTKTKNLWILWYSFLPCDTQLIFFNTFPLPALLLAVFFFSVPLIAKLYIKDYFCKTKWNHFPRPPRQHRHCQQMFQQVT